MQRRENLMGRGPTRPPASRPKKLVREIESISATSAAVSKSGAACGAASACWCSIDIFDCVVGIAAASVYKDNTTAAAWGK
jgi:hypothetical protein